MIRSIALAALATLSIARADPRPHPRLILTPALLDALAARAREGRPEWKALKARCEALAAAKVEWPDGNAYPAGDDIGAAYQGEGYREALQTLGLCYQVARRVEPARAAGYGKRGAEVLEKMSAPDPPHAPAPLHDDGYGIRNYGVGMAFGYDWLNDQLAPPLRARVAAALDRWIAAFDQKGFGRDHPQGNYFAGWYAAKGLAALALDGESAQAAPMWQDFETRLHRQMVQPYYARHLEGGGWPEGWSYGPLGTLNMVWPTLAARSARGLDWVHDPAQPFRFPIDQALYLIHFTWPSRLTIDQRGSHHPGTAPSATNSAIFSTLSGVLEGLRDPLAAPFHRYAREVREKRGDKVEPWLDFLFWDRAAQERDYRWFPRSYVAVGMQSVAMRSGWDEQAVWANFTAGTYVGSGDSGEMDFDQGGLVIVRGDKPLLATPLALLYRNSPGTQDGDLAEKGVYDDNYGNNDADPSLGNRTLYNIFYARAHRFGQIGAPPEEARTRLGAFEDGGGWLLARGVHLEDMYRKPKKEHRPVQSWTRQVVYLRPGWFVVDDRTEIARDDGDQWMAFHLGAPPRPSPSPAGVSQFQVGAGADFRGQVTALLPEGAQTKIVDVFDRHRVWRLEVRPGAPGAAQRWLTVLDAAVSPGDAARVSRIGRANATVLEGEATGAAIYARDATRVVVTLDAGERLRYKSGLERTLHLVVGLAPGQGYTVSVAAVGGGREVTVASGGRRIASPSGCVAFAVGPEGTIGDWIYRTGTE